jgi:hypothetical protein
MMNIDIESLNYDEQLELLNQALDQLFSMGTLRYNENGDLYWSATGEVAIKNRAKFRLLVDWACDEAGSKISIVDSDDKYLYYYDGCDRWCSVEKSLEGVEFDYE